MFTYTSAPSFTLADTLHRAFIFICDWYEHWVLSKYSKIPDQIWMGRDLFGCWFWCWTGIFIFFHNFQKTKYHLNLPFWPGISGGCICCCCCLLINEYRNVFCCELTFGSKPKLFKHFFISVYQTKCHVSIKLKLYTKVV